MVDKKRLKDFYINDNNYLLSGFFETVDWNKKVQYYKDIYGSRFKIHKNFIEALMYLRNKFSPEDECIRYFDEDIYLSDLISDKKMYTICDDDEDVFDIQECEDGAVVYSDSLLEKIFEEYVEPYCEYKFTIQIGKDVYELELSPELFDKNKKIILGRHRMYVTDFINGNYELRMFGPGMTKLGTEFNGDINAPVISGRVTISLHK